MAQGVISGSVRDTEGKPVERAVVKLLLEERTLGYTMTDTLGHYSIKRPADVADKTLTLSFSSLGFARQEVTVAPGKRNETQDVTLKADPKMLDELRVYAPPVRLSGDTITYNLAQFLGKGDVTLEDGLRRLPGIDVGSDGTISYMGKDINHFYIEGLDMLGGRYNARASESKQACLLCRAQPSLAEGHIATRNLRTDHVTQVEVLRHHKDKRIDHDEESDNVALNVKLSDKAKFRPMGQPTLGLGIREKDALYAAGATGMMFKSDFQTICTAKYSNFGDFASYELIEHSGGSGLASNAQTLFPSFGGGAPPIGEYRYQRDGSVSLNAIAKIDSSRQVKSNINYSYEHNDYTASNSTTYFTGGESVSVSERISPVSTLHSPSVSVNYQNDTESKYVSNDLSLKAQFETNGNTVRQTVDGAASDIGQERKVRSFWLADNAFVEKVIGKHKLRISVDNSLTLTPSLDMAFSVPTDSSLSLINQQCQSTSFRTRESTAFSLRLPRQTRIDIPVSFEGTYDYINTLRLPDSSQNDIRGWRLSPSASPKLEWRAHDDRLLLNISTTLKLLSMCYYPKDEPNVRLHRLYAEPSLRLRYTVSPSSELRLTSNYSNSVGDALSLLTHEMQTGYRSVSAASGIIATQKTWDTQLLHKWELPMSFFTLSASAGWTQSWSNVLNSQYVSGVDVSSGTILGSSHSRNASLRLNASKSFTSIRSKLSLGGSYVWGSSQSVDQDEPVTTRSNSIGANGGVTISPLTWTELTYSLNYGFSRVDYLSRKQHNQSFSHRGRLAFYPVKELELALSYNHVRQQLAEGDFKNFELFDASAQWKHKKLLLRLAMENLLNTRHIAWTLLSGTNSYSYNYNLCGRSARLSATMFL